MVSCISCKISHVVRGRKGISFHRFPANPILRESWLEFLKLKESELPLRAHLCSQHFDETSFDRSSRLKVQLKRDAIPSIVILRKRNDRRSTGWIVFKEDNDVPNEKAKNSLIDDETLSPIKIEEEHDVPNEKTKNSLIDDETLSSIKIEEEHDVPNEKTKNSLIDDETLSSIKIEEEHDVPNEKTKNSLIDDETLSSIKIEYDIDISDTKVEESYIK